MSIWKSAIEDALNKTLINIDRFYDKFPHVSEKGRYQLNSNTSWTEGFWSGILWLSYEYSKDEVFHQAAEQTVESFRKRLMSKSCLDHHDIGFLYSLSTKAKWLVNRDVSAKELTIQAADVLMERWRPESQIIQAWGSEGDAENGGKIIIDCLMNLPLLYWASEHTGDRKYKDVAVIHADRSRRFLIRGDDSSYHTFLFEPKTGEAIRGATAQGYSDGSTWTRGQAWGIYGFALSYHYTRNLDYLETAKRMGKYFLAHLPEDHVVYWDFNVKVSTNTERDSSASAIAACGILEILKHISQEDADYLLLQEGAIKMMESLVRNYSTMCDPNAEGLIEHGSYAVGLGANVDDFMIWGDYYYLEALMRLEKDHSGYWYE